MNLLMCAPLCDSKGNVRYFIGAQIDVSGLIMDDARMDSMKELTAKTAAPALNGYNSEHANTNGDANGDAVNENENYTQLPAYMASPKKAGAARNNLMEFAELLSPGELSMIREHGGSLFEPVVPRRDRPYMGHMRPRIMLKQERTQSRDKIHPIRKQPNLPGVYDHVCIHQPLESSLPRLGIVTDDVIISTCLSAPTLPSASYSRRRPCASPVSCSPRSSPKWAAHRRCAMNCCAHL